MKAGAKRSPSQDELELERKRREFHTLEHRLVRLEHDLEDLREEVREFEKLYAEKMAERIAELDQLKRELAETAPAGEGTEPEEAAEGGRQRYGFREEPPEQEEIPRIRPTVGSGDGEGIKEIYRRVAKAIHPDLAANEDERKRRQKLMAEANRAYAEEDRVTLRAIMEEWETDPETAVAIGTAGELALVIRRINRLGERIRAVELEIARLRNSELYRLIQRVEEARWRGRDMIAEMGARLDAEILAACRILNERGRAAREQAEESRATFRVVHFPGDRPLGTLFVRERNSGSFLDWKRLGEALGNVAVPAGKALRLDVQDEATADLARLDSLGPYDLQACFIYGGRDADLAPLLRFKGIEELYLSGDGITSDGITRLQELRSLERLYLYDTAVGDAGIVSLRQLPRLRSLTLCNTPVSEAGLDRLKLAAPACRVVRLRSGR
ncbi:hypothetical protein GURASL_33120 [Geotalea uraniireducens]|uniref:J domain-containing protein n=1 Tax=Geotalea uraniireducens TaxID=351604 RepID=A0ABM8EPK0_9BACT|nr:hypothetical protein [Geotalea uraniireducens]BDV44389.1 hypothetical protein GURASL_33120 [Geotalea uraniireducens]